MTLCLQKTAVFIKKVQSRSERRISSIEWEINCKVFLHPLTEERSPERRQKCHFQHPRRRVSQITLIRINQSETRDSVGWKRKEPTHKTKHSARNSKFQAVFLQEIRRTKGKCHHVPIEAQLHQCLPERREEVPRDSDFRDTGLAGYRDSGFRISVLHQLKTKKRSFHNDATSTLRRTRQITFL